MTGLYLALYMIALDTMTVFQKNCIENAGSVTYNHGVEVYRGLGLTCNQHGNAMSTTCIHAGSKTMARVILLKDKTECENHPERELHNLKVMMKKEYK